MSQMLLHVSAGYVAPNIHRCDNDKKEVVSHIRIKIEIRTTDATC